jgi:hypothetical protein
MLASLICVFAEKKGTKSKFTTYIIVILNCLAFQVVGEEVQLIWHMLIPLRECSILKHLKMKSTCVLVGEVLQAHRNAQTEHLQLSMLATIFNHSPLRLSFFLFFCFSSSSFHFYQDCLSAS